ncbi:methyl-accepting chemotaxis protein [Paraglaciecola sp.]|uniref:methyl-accepting chemotaxis protein n=1 Tax=Paraglaciecola sp. TaxID=1920173 RepID=UPI003EF31C89
MSQLISKICNPAKLLMAQFDYSTKFILLCVIMISPLVVSLAFLNYEYGDEIRFTEKEKIGLNIINSSQRDLFVIADRVMTGSGQSLPSSQLKQLDNEIQIGVGSDVSASLASYYESITLDDPVISFDRLAKFMKEVADYSNLELDLSLDTSYLVTTLVKGLPDLQLQLAKTLNLSLQVTEVGSFTPETYIALSNANQKLPLSIENTGQNLGVSLSANSNVSYRLKEEWELLDKKLVSLTNTIQNQILDPDEILIDNAAIRLLGIQLNKDVNNFSKQVMPLLAELLQNRIDKASFKRNVVMSISALAVVLSLYLFIGMYLSVIENIKRVSSNVHKIADGDLSTRVEVIGKDEMRLIANDMNVMTSNLQHLVQRISQAIGTLNESAQSLKLVTQTTITGVDEQQIGTRAIVTSMSEMTSSAKAVDHNSDLASSAAIDADKEAQQGITLVTKLQSVMHDMQEESERSQVAIERLVKDSQEIGQFSTAINEIAEQTNLLSLNAAIEAARAGEQGRGFAVVADEVRTLAKRTQDQTNQIHSIISNIQNATEETKSSMEQSREQMNLSVQEATIVGEALERISSVITAINDMSSEISKSTSAQSLVTDQVASKVEEIASISEATLVGAKETGSSAEQLMAVVETLSHELAQLQKGHH